MPAQLMLWRFDLEFKHLAEAQFSQSLGSKKSVSRPFPWCQTTTCTGDVVGLTTVQPKLTAFSKLQLTTKEIVRYT